MDTDKREVGVVPTNLNRGSHVFSKQKCVPHLKVDAVPASLIL